VPAPHLRVDDRERLHHEDGPAAWWPEGDEYYFWHGVEVPPHVIRQPERLKAHELLQYPNAEVRRVAIERMGYERFLGELHAGPHHEDEDGAGNKRRLYFLIVRQGEVLALVQVECPSTGHKYFLRVDPNAYGGLRTCQQAIASTWRRPDGSLVFSDPQEYVPVVET
jgi:hypothetical protein